jgi:uncharacterized protein YndB with AHSA1/START domain
MTKPLTLSGTRVTLTKLYHHSPQELFDAWTNLESLKQWL